MTDYLLSDEDRHTVEHIAARAWEKGPEAVTSAVAIHTRQLTTSRAELRQLLVKVEQRRRSIAMREEALRILGAGS